MEKKLNRNNFSFKRKISTTFCSIFTVQYSVKICVIGIPASVKFQCQKKNIITKLGKNSKKYQTLDNGCDFFLSICQFQEQDQSINIFIQPF